MYLGKSDCEIPVICSCKWFQTAEFYFVTYRLQPRRFGSRGFPFGDFSRFGDGGTRSVV